jgi:hypothetical protein
MPNETHQPAMPVADIRKNLQAIRRAWAADGPVTPMLLCLDIAPGLTISEFTFRFVLQQHNRRYKA